ncbi:MAG: sigma-70 family RNA polymerase sigma factor [Anaerolineales bacterium]|nr:sigma-70 family RNA polymerase sigma factor [Anaerolineales bacterium]MCB8962774.1 sigma-70 family RNA polymerase sigma factor [Ardenticatenales bacterium]MCB0005295.1 sigma-70 family RNA polymerase sigma factor [Anaerolineales bacterium]MCB0010897.1 sigma-70 family RNA polymerase sigma factor [Anaerolineales bacterium]MCB0017821.1 sigma-70 family RNA polymerase sigma factor [Anaerolineales bacterium]
MTEDQQLDELALLARARVLDQGALAEIHRRYYTAIYRYITFRVPDRDLAEDLTSEVFTRLLSAIRDKNAPQNTLRGWLYRVAGHIVADYYRKRARQKETELSDSLPSRGVGPDELVDLNLTNEALREAMGELTEDQQAVLQLRYGGGLRFREVAVQLGKSENAVKQLQLRALATLQRTLVARKGMQ